MQKKKLAMETGNEAMLTWLLGPAAPSLMPRPHLPLPTFGWGGEGVKSGHETKRKLPQPLAMAALIKSHVGL